MLTLLNKVNSLLQMGVQLKKLLLQLQSFMGSTQVDRL